MRPEKAYAVAEMGRLLDGASSLIVTTFTGLDSARMNTLRTLVNEKSGRYFVVKNRAFAIASRDRGMEELPAVLRGQVGVIFGEDDFLELLKALVDFGKKNEELKVLGGVFEGEVRLGKDMLAIAAMPPKEVAAGELVSTLASPLSGVVQLLSDAARSFVLVIASIGEKKVRSASE
jgi:large subunit ribosomal protein L10